MYVVEPHYVKMTLVYIIKFDVSCILQIEWDWERLSWSWVLEFWAGVLYVQTARSVMLYSLKCVLDSHLESAYVGTCITVNVQSNCLGIMAIREMFVSCFAKASCRLTGWKSQDRLDLAHLPFKCKTHTSLYSACIYRCSLKPIICHLGEIWIHSLQLQGRNVL